MKKLLSFVVLCCLFASTLFGCGTSKQDATDTTKAEASATSVAGTETAKAEAIPVKLVMFGEQSKRMAELMQNEISKKVLEDINVKMEIQYLPWTEYAGGKSELMLASGDKFFSYCNTDVEAKYVAKGYYADLTNVYKESAKNIIANCGGETNFDAFKIDGKQYAIPVGYKPASGEDYVWMVRQDLMDEVGVKTITSIADLENFYTLVKAKHPDYIGMGRGFTPNEFNGAIASDKNIMTMNSFAMTDANAATDSTIYSFYESEEYKQMCEITGRWNKMGIIPSYQLSNPTQVDAEFMSGKGMFCNSTNDRIFEFDANVRNSAPNALFTNFYIGDKTKKPLINRGTYTVAFGVSAGVESEEEKAAYVSTIDLFQKNQEWVDLWTYGIKDVDYKVTDNGRVERINTDEIIHNWMPVNTNFRRYPTYVLDSQIETFNKWDEGSIVAKNLNFVFNLEPVKAEYAQLQAVEQEYIAPISAGFKDYNSNIKVAIAKLKAAGLDKFLAEMQKQFDAFMKSKQ